MTNARNSTPDFRIIILSENYFLWRGLTSLISMMMTPRPDIFWINSVSPEGILRVREQIMKDTAHSGWMIFTDECRVNDIQAYLPAGRVSVLADNLSVIQLSQCLRNADFTHGSLQDATLTRQELRVCTLISKGISLIRIAHLLNKSPKTIYTHKRNAMSKFHCQNLAEFHRKICLLEQHSLYL
ncbi:helix-turn-helix transcriptional regulator [Enterobacter huaxiensis]|uniref:helix-turn-helix transcriptional regulator n=1 Tax=Enterobacter huaxiensis TaxID=2494702 RepID=UPI0021D803C4|nr:helix-turn-helix transcriptional regulator [Enterobacter huaxiensis]